MAVFGVGSAPPLMRSLFPLPARFQGDRRNCVKILRDFAPVKERLLAVAISKRNGSHRH
jgi:hypothetical protein